METMDAIQDALGPKIDLVEAILRMPNGIRETAVTAFNSACCFGTNQSRPSLVLFQRGYCI
jgi:hypothetical protein